MRFINRMILIVCLAAALWGESQVSISTPTQTAAVGDRINVKVIAKTSDKIDEIALETPGKNFEIISQESLPRREFKDYLMYEINLVISFFSTGNHTIGPFTVNQIQNRNIVESKKTNSIEITVQSVLTEDDKDIKDLKNVISLKGNPYHFLKYVFIILALVSLGIFLFWYLKKRKKQREISPLPVLSPLEELEATFQKLLGKNLVEKGEVKQFFIQLTVLIKHYLHRKYRFNAQDLTSSETMFYLQKKESLDSIHRDLDHIFTISDLVKFAKFIPGPPDIQQVEQRVRSIISAQKKKITGENQSQNVSIPK